MLLREVTFGCAPDRLAPVTGFYADVLGLPTTPVDGVVIDIGGSRVRFVAADGDPFHHFALLVPRGRFDPAFAWARDRLNLLPILGSNEVVIDFDNWDARACYFHDPAGNIVELIAHEGIRKPPTGRAAPFDPAELRGLSEVGLVGDVAALSERFGDLGLLPFQGDPTAGELAFLGEPTGTLILAPEGRGWLPTGRPAEPWPVTVTVDSSGTNRSGLAAGAHHVTFRG